MKIPTITGVIRRRILLNYRVAPEVLRGILPSTFRPKLVAGQAIAGICLIRLEEIRPKGMPAMMGLSSENSAHRIAVEWNDLDGALCEGVFVPRRDTDSRLNAMAGGRIFPGVHHLSKFTVNDAMGRISLKVEPDPIGRPLVDLDASEDDAFPSTSIFSGLEESSRFFEAGCVGYSTRPDSCILDGLMLEVEHWKVTPLKVHSIRSTYFDDLSVFPPESIAFDHALLMRDIPHLWHSQSEMRSDG
jgi:hypothetical protein